MGDPVCGIGGPLGAAFRSRMFLMFLVFGLVPFQVLATDGAVARPVGDPAVEARVARLAEDLRCLTCMGQSIADSQSSFSSDMKREMRTMIAAGKSDKEIMDFMVQRYGDFVLYRPPVKSTTWLLWGGPFLLLLLGLVFLVAKVRKRSAQVATQLTEAEHLQAVDLLRQDKGNRP